MNWNEFLQDIIVIIATSGVTNIIIASIIGAIFKRRNDSISNMNVNVHKALETDTSERRALHGEIASLHHDIRVIRNELNTIKVELTTFNEREVQRAKQIEVIMREEQEIL